MREKTGNRVTLFHYQELTSRFLLGVELPSLCSKEYNIAIDLNEKTIEGDVVAYGSWYDVPPDECMEALERVLPNVICESLKNWVNEEKSYQIFNENNSSL